MTAADFGGAPRLAHMARRIAGAEARGDDVKARDLVHMALDEGYNMRQVNESIEKAWEDVDADPRDTGLPLDA